MKRVYTVSKDEKTGLWYAHKVGYPRVPVFGSFSRNKRTAQKYAANCMGISLKEYLRIKEC